VGSEREIEMLTSPIAGVLILARRLADLPQTSLRQMKRILARVASGPLEEALSLETKATAAGFLDPESTRRITRF
jgi:enoyl-CoA hydratase/carnithine racemase